VGKKGKTRICCHKFLFFLKKCCLKNCKNMIEYFIKKSTPIEVGLKFSPMSCHICILWTIFGEWVTGKYSLGSSPLRARLEK
jgi:hypothetical protein